MIRFFKSILITGSFIFMINCAGIPNSTNIDDDVPSVHPALDIVKLYRTVTQSKTVIVPYFVNLMAIDLLKQHSHYETVKLYIEWYLSHLNYPDKYGLTGSIYDYTVDPNGNEVSLETYDSVDSYAGTFIMLVERYYNLTWSRTFIQNNRQKLEDIAYLIPYLRSNDGLTIAIPGTTAKYLMDNCEALGGVSAFAQLAANMGWETQSYYRTQEDIIRDAVMTHFRDRANGNFYWFIDGDIHKVSQWEIFYPDAYAQLFPILFGVIIDPRLRNDLWDTFNAYHKNNYNNFDVEQKIIYKWTEEIMERDR